MRRTCAMIIMVLLSCGAAQAQSATTQSGMGATSPLGILGSSASSGTGVPLGATEIDPGGLSPATSCVPTDPSVLGNTSTTTGTSTTSGLSGTSSATSGSTFDGGGIAGSVSSN